MVFEMSLSRAGQRACFCLAAWFWAMCLALPAAGASARVPEVVGQKLPAAQKILLQAGCRVKATGQATFFPGEHLKVFRQYPRAGSPPGGWSGVVEIWYYDQDLARGDRERKQAESKANKAGEQGRSPAKLIFVPMVRGSLLGEAEEMLRKAGLILSVEGSIPTSDRKLLLKVADQRPIAGTLVPRNSKVSIYLFRLRDYKTPQEIKKGLEKKRDQKKTMEP